MHDIDQELELMLQGKFDEGWKICEKLQAIGPDEITDPRGQKNPEMWVRHNFNRGWFLLQQGKYQEGSQLLESGRYLNTYGSPPLRTNAPIYNPNEHDIKGKSIIVNSEGGFGDEIIHARFATSFKKLGAAKVYLTASPELISVFSRIEGVDGVITKAQTNTVAHDYWAPGFSSGWLCGHTFETLPGKPYLTALPMSIELWKQIIRTDKKKIGIRWSGNPRFEHQQFRRFPPEFMINLTKYTDLQVYSFQRDHNVVEIPSNIVDLQHLLISWEDTLAALSLMDVVITSCTSIAHAAAALGKETWVVVPLLPYHVWAYKANESTKNPYYDAATIYRQQEPGKWNTTFQRLYADLEQKFQLPHVELPNCDKEVKKLNMGCGFQHHEGFLNVDKFLGCSPNQVVDFDVYPWPWENETFDHIIAKDILEHIGSSPKDFVDIIKEMYRISKNGAIWEIVVPHWRCDNAINDPTHVRLITRAMFEMFNAKSCKEYVEQGQADTPLALINNVDVEVCEARFDYVPYWIERVRTGKMTEEELTISLNTLNNVAQSMRLLVQVHKPERFTLKDVKWQTG